MQTADLMCPPADGDLAPLGQQCRVVVFFLSNLAYPVGEFERIDEITECTDPRNSWRLINVYSLPVAVRSQKLVQFIGARWRRPGPASFALLLAEIRHWNLHYHRFAGKTRR